MDYILGGQLLVLFFALLWFFISNNFFKKNKILDNKLLIILFLTTVSFYWGLRPFDVGTDTGNYYNAFISIDVSKPIHYYLSSLKGDYLFYIVLYVCRKYLDFSWFLTFCSFITSLGFYLLYKNFNLGKKIENHLLAPVFIFLYFSLFSYTSIYCNIIRNGCALPYSLLFVLKLFNKEYKLSFIYMIVSLSFHMSSIILILIALGLFFVKISVPSCFIIYLSCVTFSILGYGLGSIPLISNLSNARLAGYLGDNDIGYTTGFRLDFTLYNFFFLLLAYILSDKKDKGFKFFFKLYVLTSSFFVLCYSLIYSDRFGIYSWFLIPIVLLFSINNFPLRKKFLISVLFLFVFWGINIIIFI
ncbi:EpsG family protein [Halosquirtibacter laminarini]|uniref:EpsG family protein n=1 Tax=Halosquirtibacter laminarini TaxID=3374600 RepID=UPI003747A03E